MLTAYIEAAMKRAAYKILDDGTYYGEVLDFPGVWADADTLEDCRRELQEVLEEWLLLQLRDNADIPAIDGISLARRTVQA